MPTSFSHSSESRAGRKRSGSQRELPEALEQKIKQPFPQNNVGCIQNKAKNSKRCWGGGGGAREGNLDRESAELEMDDLVGRGKNGEGCVPHDGEAYSSKLRRLLKGYLRTGEGVLLMQWNLMTIKICNQPVLRFQLAYLYLQNSFLGRQMVGMISWLIHNFTWFWSYLCGIPSLDLLFYPPGYSFQLSKNCYRFSKLFYFCK